MRQIVRGALAALLLLPLAAGHPATASVGTDEGAVLVDRLAGENRWVTAALVSEQFPNGVDTVFLANGEDWAQGADAVVAGAAAGSGTVPATLPGASGAPAPILMVKAGSIPSATRAALAELRPEHAVVLGGTTVVSTAVERELLAMGIEPLRVWGTNRYGTAAALADAFAPGVERVYVATGEATEPPRNSDYPWMIPDALTASARAGAEDVPVLLTKHGTVPAATLAALQRLDPRSITIVGGHNAVSLAVELELAEIAPVTRVSGDTRYATAAALFADYPVGAPRTYIASGEYFVDALALSALAASEGAPVLLSRGGLLTQVSRDRLVSLDPAAVRVVGGERVAPDSLLEQVRTLLGG